VTARPIGDGANLRPLTGADAAAVLALLDANRAHLDKWLRWSAHITSREDVDAMIARQADALAEGRGFHWGIWVRGELAGGVICHDINRLDQGAEVGYWLGEAHTGKGLATRASAAAVDHLLRAEHLHRIEMLCGVGNARSRAVAERLGFVNEGVRRESHWITDRYVDHVVYGLLAHEWKRHA
jgi:ribosomal-protein-serine acetyltransferase